MKAKDNIWMKLGVVYLALMGFAACDDPYEEGEPYLADVEVPIATYLSSHEEYTQWVEVLKRADMWGALNDGLGNYTAFAPTNGAVQTYLQGMNVGSAGELDAEYAKYLVKQHIHTDSLTKDDFLGKSYLKNMLGENIYVEIDTLNAGQAILYDDFSKVGVTELALRASNGFVYQLNGVMKPLVETAYDRIGESVEDCSIFKRALDETGWADSLKQFRDTLYNYGAQVIHTHYYTVFSVPNSAFEAERISSFEALVERLEATDDYTSRGNALNEYVAYHVIKGDYDLESLCPSGLGNDTVKLWSPMALETVLAVGYKEDADSGEGVLSLNSKKVTSLRTIAAMNGWVITVSDWMPIWESEPTALIWDLTDYYEVKEMVERNDPEHYQKLTGSSDKRYTIPDNLGCYWVVRADNIANTVEQGLTYVTSKDAEGYRDPNLYDRLAINIGYNGSVDMSTPTIVKGKYKVDLDFFYERGIHTDLQNLEKGSNGGRIEVMVDSDPQNQIICSPYATVTSKSAGIYSVTLYDEIEFTTTESHDFRFVVRDPAASTNGSYSLQFDCIRFTPITEE